MSEEIKNEKIAYIGIDQSYHSTGMTIRYSDRPNIKFFQLCDSTEKHSQTVVFKIYNRVFSNTNDFSTNEINRIKSAHNLFNEIYKCIQMHCAGYRIMVSFVYKCIVLVIE